MLSGSKIGKFIMKSEKGTDWGGPGTLPSPKGAGGDLRPAVGSEQR